MMQIIIQSFVENNNVEGIQMIREEVERFLFQSKAISSVVMKSISSVEMLVFLMNCINVQSRLRTIRNFSTLFRNRPDWANAIIYHCSPYFIPAMQYPVECEEWRDVLLPYAKTYEDAEHIMYRYCISYDSYEHFLLLSINADWCKRWCQECNTWTVFSHFPLNTLVNHINSSSTGDYGAFFQCLLKNNSYNEPFSFDYLPAHIGKHSDCIMDFTRWLFSSHNQQTIKKPTSKEMIAYISRCNYMAWFELVTFFQKQGMNINHHCEKYGKTLLHRALLGKHTPMLINFLLGCGSDPSETNNDLHPIIYDVSSKEVLELFLKSPLIQIRNYPLLLNYMTSHKLQYQLFHHMNPCELDLFKYMCKTVDHTGVSVYHYCDTVEEVHFFMRYSNAIPYHIINRRVGYWCENVVFRAVRKNLLELAKFWIHYKVNPNRRDRNGDNLFHIVQDIELCNIIHATGKVNLNARNKKGLRPIDIQAKKGRLEIVKWMEERGCIVDKKYGTTGMQLLSHVNKPEMAIHLISRGHSPNYKDIYRKTAWMSWANYSNWDTLKAVLVIRPIRASIDMRGNTVLHHMKCNKFTEEEDVILSGIIKYHPELINRKNSDGLRPIDISNEQIWIEKMILYGSIFRKSKYLQHYYAMKLETELRTIQSFLARAIPTSVLPKDIMNEIGDFFNIEHMRSKKMNKQYNITLSY